MTNNRSCDGASQSKQTVGTAAVAFIESYTWVLYSLQYFVVPCTVHCCAVHCALLYRVLCIVVPCTVHCCTVHCALLYRVLCIAVPCTVHCCTVYCSLLYRVLFNVVPCTVHCCIVYCALLYRALHCTMHFTARYSTIHTKQSDCELSTWHKLLRNEVRNNLHWLLQRFSGT